MLAGWSPRWTGRGRPGPLAVGSGGGPARELAVAALLPGDAAVGWGAGCAGRAGGGRVDSASRAPARRAGSAAGLALAVTGGRVGPLAIPGTGNDRRLGAEANSRQFMAGRHGYTARDEASHSL